MRISDWSSDVCSSDLDHILHLEGQGDALSGRLRRFRAPARRAHRAACGGEGGAGCATREAAGLCRAQQRARLDREAGTVARETTSANAADRRGIRSEEPTSELQSLMRISYAVFSLKKKHIVYRKP